MADQTEIFSSSSGLSEADEELSRLYADVGRSVDRLAYTPQFDQLFEEFREAGFDMDKPEVFRRLLMLRKAGLLPRLFRSTSSDETPSKSA